MLPEEKSFKDRFHHCFGIGRNRDGDTKRGFDLLVLAEKYVQDDAIDLVVHSVIGEHANSWVGLTKTIYTPLTLFVTSGVPTEVIVDNSIKMILEVDTLRETIGANQNTRGIF